MQMKMFTEHVLPPQSDLSSVGDLFFSKIASDMNSTLLIDKIQFRLATGLVIILVKKRLEIQDLYSIFILVLRIAQYWEK